MPRSGDLHNGLVAVPGAVGSTTSPLPPYNRDDGDWSRYRECHLWPGLLLMYAKPSVDVPRIVGRGSHSDLFDYRPLALPGMPGDLRFVPKIAAKAC